MLKKEILTGVVNWVRVERTERSKGDLSIKPMILANFCRVRKLEIGSDNNSLCLYGTFTFIILLLFTNALKIEKTADGQ